MEMKRCKHYILGALIVASTALTACSSKDDSMIDQPVNPIQKTYTMTIHATKGDANGDDGAMLRSLSLDATTHYLDATWELNEVVKVAQLDDAGKLEEIGELKVISFNQESNTNDAILSGNVTGIDVNKPLWFFLHSVGIDFRGQSGVLLDEANSIEKKYDFAGEGVISSNYTVDDSKNLISLNRPIDLQSQQSIVKFTLCKADGTPIKATALTICDISSGDKKLVESFNFRTMLPACGGLTITPTAATSEFYVAMCCRGSIDIQLLAETEDGIYSFRKNSVTFEIGKYYEIKVKMAMQTINLSTRNADYEAQDGDVITGNFTGYKLTIADGATVTLMGTNITTGISCNGNATITIVGTNTASGPDNNPGIFVPKDKTLTIQGNGSITANGGQSAPGIGGGRWADGGNILITSGHVTASGQGLGAGIGSGGYYSCGNITITGGTVEANAGYSGAGIGTGEEGKCGDITITNTVVKVTAKKSSSSCQSIGAGYGYDNTPIVGTITVGGTVYPDGITDNIVYEP